MVAGAVVRRASGVVQGSRSRSSLGMLQGRKLWYEVLSTNYFYFRMTRVRGYLVVVKVKGARSRQLPGGEWGGENRCAMMNYLHTTLRTGYRYAGHMYARQAASPKQQQLHYNTKATGNVENSINRIDRVHCVRR